MKKGMRDVGPPDNSCYELETPQVVIAMFPQFP